MRDHGISIVGVFVFGSLALVLFYIITAALYRYTGATYQGI